MAYMVPTVGAVSVSIQTHENVLYKEIFTNISLMRSHCKYNLYHIWPEISTFPKSITVLLVRPRLVN